jgi:hypothetical protein
MEWVITHHINAESTEEVMKFDFRVSMASLPHLH